MHAKPLTEGMAGGDSARIVKSAVVKDSKITWTYHFDVSGKLISPKTTFTCGKDSAHPAIVNYQNISNISRETVPLAIDSAQPGTSLEISTYFIRVGISLNGNNVLQVIDSVKANVVRSGGRAITQASIMDYAGSNFADSLHYWLVKTFTNIGEDGRPLDSTVVLGMCMPFSISYAVPGQGDRINELTAVAAPIAISRQREHDSTNTWTGWVETKISFAFGRYAPGIPPITIIPATAAFVVTELTGGIAQVNTPVDIGITAYPNPARAGQPINVSFSMPEKATVTIAIFDALGRKVHETAGEYAPGQSQIVLNSVQNPGAYLISLMANGKTTTAKFIVLE